MRQWSAQYFQVLSHLRYRILCPPHHGTEKLVFRHFFRRNQDNFIPLVNEIWLKHPDLYRLNSHNLYGSSYLEGSRSTPVATPLSDRHQSVWDANCGSVTHTASKVNATAPNRHGQASERGASSPIKGDQNGGTVNATTNHCAHERCYSSEDIQLDSTKPLAPFSQNPQVSRVLLM